MNDMQFVPGLGWVSTSGPINKAYSSPERLTESERAMGGKGADGGRFHDEGVLRKHELVGEESDHKHDELKEEKISAGVDAKDVVEDEYAPDEAVMPTGKTGKPKAAADMGDAENVEEDVEGEEENYDKGQEAESETASASENLVEEKKSVVLERGAAVWLPERNVLGQFIKEEADGTVVLKSEGRLITARIDDVMPV